jgi:hypothetical protein
VPHASSAATTQHNNATTGQAVSNNSMAQDVVEKHGKKQEAAPFGAGQRNKQKQADQHFGKKENNKGRLQLPAPVASSSDLVKTIPEQAPDQSVPVAPRLNKSVATSNHPLPSLPVLFLKELPQVPRKLHLNTFAYSPALPYIQPVRSHKWHYGVSFSTGRLHESGNWESNYLSAGLQVQYRLTTKLHLFGGLEWIQGKCRFDAKPDLGGALEFSRSQFPFIPPFPQGPPPLPSLDFYVQSHWNGLSIPLGITLYQKSPYRRIDWVLRTYYKPQFALLRENEVWAPFTSLDKQLYATKKQALRAGWIGAQAGLSSHLHKRFHAELTLNAEQALQPVNLEQVNYQAFSLRLAVFRR